MSVPPHRGNHLADHHYQQPHQPLQQDATSQYPLPPHVLYPSQNNQSQNIPPQPPQHVFPPAPGYFSQGIPPPPTRPFPSGIIPPHMQQHIYHATRGQGVENKNSLPPAPPPPPPPPPPPHMVAQSMVSAPHHHQHPAPPPPPSATLHRHYDQHGGPAAYPNPQQLYDYTPPPPPPPSTLVNGELVQRHPPHTSQENVGMDGKQRRADPPIDPSNLTGRLGISPSDTPTSPSATSLQRRRWSQLYGTLTKLSHSHDGATPSRPIFSLLSIPGGDADSPPSDVSIGIPAVVSTLMAKSNHQQLQSSIISAFLGLPIPPTRKVLSQFFDPMFLLLQPTSNAVLPDITRTRVSVPGNHDGSDGNDPKMGDDTNTREDGPEQLPLTHLVWYLLDLLDLYSLLRMKLRHLQSNSARHPTTTTPNGDGMNPDANSVVGTVRAHYQTHLQQITRVFAIISNPLHIDRELFDRYLSDVVAIPPPATTMTLLLDVMVIYSHTTAFNRSPRFLHFMMCHPMYIHELPHLQEILSLQGGQQHQRQQPQHQQPQQTTTPSPQPPSLTPSLQKQTDAAQPAKPPMIQIQLAKPAPTTNTPAQQPAKGFGSISINLGQPKPAIKPPAPPSAPQPISIGLTAAKPKPTFPSININLTGAAKPTTAAPSIGVKIGTGTIKPSISLTATRGAVGVGSTGAGHVPSKPATASFFESGDSSSDEEDDDHDNDELYGSDAMGLHHSGAPSSTSQSAIATGTHSAQRPAALLASLFPTGTTRWDRLRAIQFAVPPPLKGKKGTAGADTGKLLSFFPFLDHTSEPSTSFAMADTSSSGQVSVPDPVAFLGNPTACLHSAHRRLFFIDDLQTVNTIPAFASVIPHVEQRVATDQGKAELRAVITHIQQLSSSNWGVFSKTTQSERVMFCHELYSVAFQEWLHNVVYPWALSTLPDDQPLCGFEPDNTTTSSSGTPTSIARTMTCVMDRLTSANHHDNLFMAALPHLYHFNVALASLSFIEPMLVGLSRRTGATPLQPSLPPGTSSRYNSPSVLQCIEGWKYRFLGRVDEVVRGINAVMNQVSILHSLWAVFTNELHLQAILSSLTYHFTCVYGLGALSVPRGGGGGGDGNGDGSGGSNPSTTLVASTFNHTLATILATHQYYHAFDMLVMMKDDDVVPMDSTNTFLDAHKPLVYTSTPIGELVPSSDDTQQDTPPDSAKPRRQTPHYGVVSTRIYEKSLLFYSLQMKHLTRQLTHTLLPVTTKQNTPASDGAPSTSSAPLTTLSGSSHTRFTRYYHLQLFSLLSSPSNALTAPANRIGMSPQPTDAGSGDASTAPPADNPPSERACGRTLADITYCQSLWAHALVAFNRRVGGPGVADDTTSDDTSPDLLSMSTSLLLNDIATQQQQQQHSSRGDHGTDTGDTTDQRERRPAYHPDARHLSALPIHRMHALLLGANHHRGRLLYKHSLQLGLHKGGVSSHGMGVDIPVRASTLHSHPYLVNLIHPYTLPRTHMVAPHPQITEVNTPLLSSVKELLSPHPSDVQIKLGIKHPLPSSGSEDDADSVLAVTCGGHSDATDDSSTSHSAYPQLNPFLVHRNHDLFETHITSLHPISHADDPTTLTRAPDTQTGDDTDDTPPLDIDDAITTLLEEVDLVKQLTREEEVMLESM